jgi:cullin-4
MFNDLALSRELTREHHSKIEPDSSAQKLSVMVLQQSVWPFAARKTSVDLPLSVILLKCHFDRRTWLIVTPVF